MSQIPEPYNRQHIFGSASSNNPSNPVQGTNLDAEFNAVEVALDETQARLAEIQRDDGALANDSVGPDQLSQEALDLINAEALSLLGQTEDARDQAEAYASLSAASAGSSASSATASASSASASAASAAQSAASSAFYYGDVAVAPTTRLDGSPLQQGDEYHNTVDHLRYNWTGLAWVALNSSAQTLEAALAAPSGATKIGYQNTGTGAVFRYLDDKLDELGKSVADFGALPNTTLAGGATALNNAAFIQASIDALPNGGTHVIPEGNWVISRPINFNKGFQSIDWRGRLVASDDFVGEYMVNVSPGGSENFYRWPIKILNSDLNCRYKNRGWYFYNMDHLYMAAPRVEAALGRGIALDKIRESLIVMPTMVNCAHRDNFATPADWDTGAYTVGQYARVRDADWLVGTAYTADNFVRDGADRYICLIANTGSQPSLNPLLWKKLPHEDYKCVVANTNKNPQTFNTNNVTVGNRVWQKVYQDEASIEVVDYVLDGSDRTNQLTLVSPIVRDCGSKCFVRVDSSKLPSRPVTHFNILSGHLHGLAAQQAGIIPELPIPDLQRCLEIGYGINVNIDGSNIRCGDGNDCISVMIGDGSTTKVSQDIRFSKCAFSGDGQRDIGLVVMPSAQASLSAELGVSFLLTHATSSEMHDPRRVMRRTAKTEQRLILPKGLTAVPGGWTVRLPTGASYADVRPYSYEVEGEASARFYARFSPTQSSLFLGDGTGANIELRYDWATGRAVVAPGKSTQVNGTWDIPLVLGSARLWVKSGGVLMIKNGSNPTSDTDGTVVGAQT